MLILQIFKKITHGGARTHNPRLRRPVPYPLGHVGVVSAAGIEPATNRYQFNFYSLSLYQLSYAEFRQRQDLNLRGHCPTDFKSASLTTRTRCRYTYYKRVNQFFLFLSYRSTISLITDFFRRSATGGGGGANTAANAVFVSGDAPSIHVSEPGDL